MTKRHFEYIADTVTILGLTLGQIEALSNRLRATNSDYKRNVFMERVAVNFESEGRNIMAVRVRRLKFSPYNNRFTGGI
jgi:hypothetical protein